MVQLAWCCYFPRILGEVVVLMSISDVSFQLQLNYGMNSPMQELIGSVMVSSLLLPVFGTLSLLLYFRLPSTFLPSKGRSITTLGTRWHDFFHYSFRYFINLFVFFTAFLFLFLGMQTRERAHCARSVFPFKKKKKKKRL